MNESPSYNHLNNLAEELSANFKNVSKLQEILSDTSLIESARLNSRYAEFHRGCGDLFMLLSEKLKNPSDVFNVLLANKFFPWEILSKFYIASNPNMPTNLITDTSKFNEVYNIHQLCGKNITRTNNDCLVLKNFQWDSNGFLMMTNYSAKSQIKYAQNLIDDFSVLDKDILLGTFFGLKNYLEFSLFKKELTNLEDMPTLTEYEESEKINPSRAIRTRMTEYLNRSPNVLPTLNFLEFTIISSFFPSSLYLNTTNTEAIYFCKHKETKKIYGG